MAVVVVDGVEGFHRYAGKQVGVSPWRVVDQPAIDRFADATEDHNWIHCDPARAAREGPFGRTIAHGYYSLALIPVMYQQVLEYRNIPIALNYGINKARFPAPVRVGSHIRLNVSVASVTPVGGALEVISDCVVEIEENDRPACAAQLVWRFYQGPSSPRLD